MRACVLVWCVDMVCVVVLGGCCAVRACRPCVLCMSVCAVPCPLRGQRHLAPEQPLPLHGRLEAEPPPFYFASLHVRTSVFEALASV